MMTEQEFVKKIKATREAYIKGAADFMDACERLDFESAFKYSMSATDILGIEVMAFMSKKYEELDTEELEERYEEVMEQVTEAAKTDEEKDEEMRQEMVSNLTKMTLGD